MHAAVISPVNGADMERQGAQVTLTDHSFGKMCRYVSRCRKMDAVSTQFCDNIFSNYDNLLCAVLNTARVAGENSIWNFLAELFSYGVRNSWTW